MGRLIEQGSFQTYADVPLNEARSTINEYSLYSTACRKSPAMAGLFRIDMVK